MLVSAFCACGDAAENAAENVNSPAADNAESAEVTQEASKFVADELPELDYGGSIVNWLCGDYMAAYYTDIWADTENGNMVNDTIFRARKNVEERLNIELAVTQFSFDWGTLSTYLNHIKSLVMSGDSTYDAYVGYPASSVVVEGGYFSDLKDNKYIDLEKPWWNQDLRGVMPSDSIYFLAGDATLTLIKHCLCVYFNQNMVNDLGITDSLYDIVRSGGWTVDKLESMIKGTYTDLNGNQEYDTEDRYGLTFGDNNKYRQLPAASKVVFSEKTADGYKFSFINEYSNNVFTRFQTLVTANESVRKAQGNTDNNTDSFASFGGNYASKIFTAGNALFTASLVGDAAFILDNSEFTVGMIPFPKFDEKQDDYYTAAQRNAAIYIQSNIYGDQFDRAGAVLEAWASECYREVMPVYFETSLKTRYATDNDMAEMFDLLRNNAVINLDYTFSTELPLNVDFFKKIDNDKLSFMSEAEKQREASELKLEELVAALKGEVQ